MRTNISVIIPVYGEEMFINRTLERLRERGGGRDFEVIVADGGPERKTLQAITDESVIKVVSRPGRGVQMNAGAALAHGDILLFLHADTELPQGWPIMIKQALSDDIRAGAFSLAMDSERFVLKMIAAAANLRTRLERIPYGDQAPFMTADLFSEMEGFAEIPLMEDVDLFRKLKRAGERIVLLKDSVVTSPRRYEREGVLRRVLGNFLLRLRFALGTPAHRLVKRYAPHAEDDK